MTYQAQWHGDVICQPHDIRPLIIPSINGGVFSWDKAFRACQIWCKMRAPVRINLPLLEIWSSEGGSSKFPTKLKGDWVGIKSVLIPHSLPNQIARAKEQSHKRWTVDSRQTPHKLQEGSELDANWDKDSLVGRRFEANLFFLANNSMLIFFFSFFF